MAIEAPGHYAAKITDDFNRLVAELKKLGEVKGFLTPDAQILCKDTIRIHKAIASDLSYATHWTISAAAFPLVWKTNLSGVKMDGFHLPYPAMALEYTFDFNVINHMKVPVNSLINPARQRVILLEEWTNEKGFVLSSVYKSDPNARIQISPLHPTNHDWDLCPFALRIPYIVFDDLGKYFDEHEDGMDILFGNSCDYPQVIMTSPAFRDLIDNLDDKQQIDIIGELSEEVKVALGLLVILSCGNAPVEKIAAPDKLNRKRARHGKAPLPIYRTLHISDHTTRKRVPGTGGHASPITHWRRGHIRMQPTAKGIIRKWIRPAIIGAGTPKIPDTVIT